MLKEEVREEMRNAIRRGWVIFPLKYNSKEPAIPNWKPYQSRKPTNREYKDWFGSNYAGNYAVVTGRISGISVMDVDPEGINTLQQIDDIDLVELYTMRAYTPNGEHYYFKYDKAIPTNREVLGPGIDTRGDGGYCVGVGSVIDGRQYTWDKFNPEEPSDPPAWLLRAPRKRVEKEPVRFGYSKIKSGNRNNAMTAIAGRLYTISEINKEVVRHILHSVNEQFVEPPLSRDEVDRIVNSVEKYENWNQYE